MLLIKKCTSKVEFRTVLVQPVGNGAQCPERRERTIKSCKTEGEPIENDGTKKCKVTKWKDATKCKVKMFDAKFTKSGDVEVKKGSGSGRVKFEYKWDDDTKAYDVHLDSMEIRGKTFKRKGEKGSKSHTISFPGPGRYQINFNNLHARGFKVQNGNKKLCFRDVHGSDCNGKLYLVPLNGNGKGTKLQKRAIKQQGNNCPELDRTVNCKI